MNQKISASTLIGRLSLRLILLAMAIGFAVRITMIFLTGPTTLDMTFWQYCGAFIIGAANDLSFAVISLLFLLLYVITAGEAKYRKPTGFILLGMLAAATVCITWFCPALQDFNKGLAKALRWVMLYWTLSFALRLFVPAIRQSWTRFWLIAILFIYVTVTLLNAVGEFFFWNEFAVRYNFIAVDYLVYTSEVIGNILESYPIVPLSVALLAVSATLTALLFRRPAAMSAALYDKKWRMKWVLIYVACSAAGMWFLNFSTRFQQSDNVYYNELQANGAYRFFVAFTKNEIDYNRFYPTIPCEEAQAIIHNTYNSTGENQRQITADTTEQHPNIILITMESMSASFMEHFGNDQHITPVLDSLYDRSLSFSRLFANGNRTVRGLEALSLSIPPSAGQSLIKRPELKPRASIGSVLRDKGYRTMFFYGGKSYFDNMGPFFSSIGFDVIDINSYRPGEISFKNIWGVCDEDSYSKLLTTLDDVRQPFFAQLMTISNHRPYTYPEGRIDIPADSKSRAGGVKYSDYALGRFLREAAKKPWFSNTIFVIVADHCASSAGETELPLENYHIPAMIYAPAMIKPQTVGYTVSQIDLMPTVLALCGMTYDSKFYGRDIFSSDYKPRAYLATYQDLGYLEGDTLTVLSPINRIRQYVLKPTADNPLNTEKLAAVDSIRARHATAHYQTSALWNN